MSVKFIIIIIIIIIRYICNALNDALSAYPHPPPTSPPKKEMLI